MGFLGRGLKGPRCTVGGTRPLLGYLLPSSWPSKTKILGNMHKTYKKHYYFTRECHFLRSLQKKRCPEWGSYKLFTLMNVHLCLFMSRDGQDDSPNMQEQEEK